MSGNKSRKIVKNTILLYIRMAVVMIVNLYLVRLVLNLLGTEDYGIYNVVAGVITMLSSVSIVLSTSVQRFYSYAIGEHNNQRIIQVFSCSFNIFFILSIAVIGLGETLGLWFVNNYLNIPPERVFAAKWVYQFSILTFVASIIKTPFSALTIAYEDMTIYAVITTLEVIFKVVLVLLISLFPCDALITYGAILMLISILDSSLYIIIAKRRYNTCKLSRIVDTGLYKSIISFSGWTFCGTIAGVGMNQINTILTNIFFGPIVNAARAISLQINSAMSTFTNSLVMAIRPPMIKSYAESDYNFVITTFNVSNKIIIYLLSIISIPLIIEMGYILRLWLGVMDVQTMTFSRLMILYSLVLALHNPITIIVQAIGDVKWYNILVESITLTCVPITYILFKLGYSASSTYVTMIVLVVIAQFVRLLFLKSKFKMLSVKEYILYFLTPAVIIFLIALYLGYCIHRIMPEGLLRLVSVSSVSFFVVVILAYFLALNSQERFAIRKIITKQ